MAKKEVVSAPTIEGEIATPRYLQLVETCKRYTKEVAVGIIKLAQALHQADYELSRKENKTLCNEVGILYDGATHRKMLTIGQVSPRFDVCLHRLPNNWTTIYKLAALRPDKFDLVIKSDRLTTFMTAKDVDEILGTGQEKATKKPSVAIILTGLDQPSRLKLYEALKALRDQYGFTLKGGDFENSAEASPLNQNA